MKNTWWLQGLRGPLIWVGDVSLVFAVVVAFGCFDQWAVSWLGAQQPGLPLALVVHVGVPLLGLMAGLWCGYRLHRADRATELEAELEKLRQEKEMNR